MNQSLVSSDLPPICDESLNRPDCVLRLTVTDLVYRGSCLLWVMSTEISVDIAVDIAVDSRSIVGR